MTIDYSRAHTRMPVVYNDVRIHMLSSHFVNAAARRAVRETLAAIGGTSWGDLPYEVSAKTNRLLVSFARSTVKLFDIRPSTLVSASAAWSPFFRAVYTGTESPSMSSEN